MAGITSHRRASISAAVAAALKGILHQARRRLTAEPATPAVACERLEERRLFTWSAGGGDDSVFHGAEIDHTICPPPIAETPSPGDSELTANLGGATLAPVRYGDGQPFIGATDLWSDAFGAPWGQSRTYAPAAYSGNSAYQHLQEWNGNRWVDNQVPQLILETTPVEDYSYVEDNGGSADTIYVIPSPPAGLSYQYTVVAMLSGLNDLFFDQTNPSSSPTGPFTNRGPNNETLVHDGSAGEYVLTDTSGDQIHFYDFGASETYEKGQFKEWVSPNGSTFTATYNSSGSDEGKLKNVVLTNGSSGALETWAYSYLPSTDANAGLLSSVQYFTAASSTVPVRQAVYTYYDGTTTGGNLHDLQSETTEDGSGNALSVNFYRYYISDSAAATLDPSYSTDLDDNGYVGGLKMVFGPDAYSRLRLNGIDPTANDLSDSSLEPYANNVFEYDGYDRVTKEVAQGAGCTCTSGSLGQGTFTFQYFFNSYTPAADYNAWEFKTIVSTKNEYGDTLATNTVYTNFDQQTMLNIFTDVSDAASPGLDGKSWATYYRYDSHGALLFTASPSAVNLPSTLSSIEIIGSVPNPFDLVGYAGTGSTTYDYLNSSTGLIAGSSYYSTGFLAETDVQQGTSGTAIITEDRDYATHTDSTTDPNAPALMYLLADDTLYGSAGGDPRVTSFAYTLSGSSNHVTAETTTFPPIPYTQDGPASSSTDTAHADTVTDDYDSYGRVSSETDGNGNVTDFSYDTLTGALGQEIQDPGTGHLALTTNIVNDALGRPHEVTSPNGNVTVYVYDDINHAVRIYPGWNASTDTTTGPVEMQDQYMPTPAVGASFSSSSYTTIYDETLTEQPTSSISLGSDSLPNGGESIGTIESLSRTLTNNAGQTVEVDDYFSLSGVSYAAGPAHLGSSSNNSSAGNYYATQFGYDSMGNLNRTAMPTGTIYRTEFDRLGDAVSHWVGTNDTPSSGWWSPTNNTSPANMVDTEDDGYDNAGAPIAPNVSEVSGGSLSGTDYYVTITWVTSGGESPAGAASVYSVDDNNLLVVTPTGVPSGVSEYNVYVSTAPGQEQLQNSSPVSTSSSWTEPTGGLVSGALATYSGVGDGNLTQVMQHPGAADPDRVSQFLYDFRDRLVAEKDGVQASEDTATHRPIYYWLLDNQGEITAAYQFDGDNLNLNSFASTAVTDSTPTSGSSNLRALTQYQYDDQGRQYEQQVFSVTPSGSSAGTVSTDSLNSFYWYDHNGNILKVLSPGGLVQKYAYDAAERQTIAYTTDGGGDTAPLTSGTWTDAGNVTGDIVLSQVETTYDADGNPTLVTDRERFNTDSSSATGALGTPSSGNEARVYYSADYYDPADRLTDTVDFGTNGATAITSPPSLGSLPSGSLHTAYGYAADDLQTISFNGNPTGGSFTLTFNGHTTSSISYSTSLTAATVQSALAGLTGVGSGNVAVTGPNGGPFVVRFMGSLSGVQQPQMTDSSSLTGGTSPTVSIVTSQPGGDDGLVHTVTDPRGIVALTDADMLGRTTASIAAFSTGVPSSASDQTTTYTYDGEDHVLTQTAVMPPGGVNQTTQWVYNATPNGGYELHSHDVLSKIEYPDPTTGSPSTSSSNDQSFSYNDLNQQVFAYVDSNLTTHIYSFDVLGRLTGDSVSTFSGSVDTSVRSLVYSYDTNGQLSTAGSYSGTNGSGTLLNQVEEQYNGLGQLTGEWQNPSGAVNTSSSPQVQYLYNGLSGTTSDGRPTGMIYPNGRQLDYVYNSGLDSNISRVSSINDDAGSGSGALQSYAYLGLDTIVQRTDGNGSALSYLHQSGDTLSSSDGGDQYTGLDRFGRVIDQNWVNTSTGTSTDRIQYGYDANSNVLYEKNLVNSAMSELFSASNATAPNSQYDALNRLLGYMRGTLSSSGSNGPALDTVSSPSQTETWTYDAVGNWTAFDNSATSNQTRSTNARNEITGISGGGATTTPTFDNNGNMTQDQYGNKYVYDAWNRIVKVENSSSTVLETYTYDTLGRRVTITPASTGVTTNLFYNTSGNVLEEQQSGTTTTQYVWGLGYVNDLVLRDDNSTSGSLGKSSSGLGRRLYVQQDANFNVISVVDTSGSVVQRFIFDPAGLKQTLDGSWATVTSDAVNMLYGWQGGRADPISGLIHFSMNSAGRDYSPTLGRWVTTDPALYIDGSNLYQAMDSNPVAYVDPAGLSSAAMAPGAYELGWRTATVDATVWVPGLDDLVAGAVGMASLMDLVTSAQVANAYVDLRKPTNPLSGTAEASASAADGMTYEQFMHGVNPAKLFTKDDANDKIDDAVKAAKNEANAGTGTDAVLDKPDDPCDDTVDTPDGRWVPYHDPEPPGYNNGAPHGDHSDALVHDGVPRDEAPAPDRELPAETNLRRGGYDGALHGEEDQLVQDLMDAGLPEDVARSVARDAIQSEIDALRNSPPPRPTDPGVLDGLPSNPMHQ